VKRAIAAAVVAVAAGAAWVAGAPAAATHRPVTVPLAIKGGQGTSNGAQPVIKVKVGNGLAVRVILDTGSVGLHIFAPGVNTGKGGGVTRTKTANSITYVDGTVQSGVIARAKITIGGVTTAKAIPFGLITRVGCVASKPDCPTANGMKGVVKHGLYGVMGVRYQSAPAGQPPNPLTSMPAPYSSSFSIAMRGRSGKLVLDAPTRNGTVLHFFGSPPKTTVCWTIGSISHVCERTLFDSGNVGLVVFGGPLTNAPTSPGTNMVAPGTRIAASAPDATQPFWSFTAGTTSSKNTASLASPGLHGNTVNASIEAFYAFTLTWNTVKRTLTLSPPS
jgi:PE-PGRS C-terminal aspartyl peptidase-like domain/Protein of unknown function (DUF3443)